jgi:hypothetical protein
MRPAFKTLLVIDFADGVLKANRVNTARPGRESFEGAVSRAGEIRIRAHGGRDNGKSVWTTAYHGQVRSQTIFEGRKSISSRVEGFTGFRSCSITFQIPVAELRTKLGLLEADMKN